MDGGVRCSTENTQTYKLEFGKGISEISPTNRHLECEIGFRGNCIYDLSLSTDNKILFVIFIRKNKIYFIDGKLPDDSILADLLILIKFIPFDGDNRTPNELLECPS